MLSSAARAPSLVLRQRAAVVAACSASRAFSASAQTEQLVQLDVLQLGPSKAPVAVITLDRPQAANALSRALMAQLNAAVRQVSQPGFAVATIIRSSSSKVFCAGADLKERKAMAQNEVIDFVRYLRRSCDIVEAIPHPTIAAMDGSALGGGLELALACDMRVAGRGTYGLPETALAIIPGAGGTQRLPRLIGPSRAKELIFTARRMDGATALKYDVVNAAVGENDGDTPAFDHAVVLAEQIARNGPIGVRASKAAINVAMEPCRNVYGNEDPMYLSIVDTEDRVEALKAFAEKRAPIFKGR